MKRLRKHKSVVRLSANTSVDNRLTHASLLLGYLFENGIDFQRRTINITGEINEDAFKLIDAAMSEMEAESKSTITIKLNSLGGDVYQAMAIVGRMQESPCRIVTKGYGAVMSAATLILASGSKRQISKYSWFMNHESSYGVEEARHSQMKALVEQTDREEKAWCEWMGALTNKPKDFWLKNGVGIDVYFTATELLELGVVDEVF